MAEVEVITARQLEEFEQLLLEHPEMKKQVKKVLASVLSKARTELSKDAKNILSTDPRQSYRAVKRTVYKRILGGALSILAKRRAGNTRVRINKQGTSSPGQMGGNRRSRSQSTDRIDGYFGSDRGFILRFLNAGTQERYIKFSSNPDIKNPKSHGGHSSYKNRNTGRRGHIESRNWFGTSSHQKMEQASEEFCKLIEEVIRGIANKNKQA